jgi:2-polyprenyl-6-methoxyphenol hydroxylase-like FAD-dependent oxidoreductase
MQSKKVLVSGASIAGPSLAFWLQKYGFEVSVVERSPSLRLGGQNIDVKGAARKIAQKMGIEEAILGANTGEVGLQFVDRNNNVRAAFPKSEVGSFTSELEILRGDLVEILYECTKNNVEYRFGDSIAALSETEDGVTVTFASGQTEKYFLVIAADGIRSKTRTLIFGDEPTLEYLGLYTTYFTIPRRPTDSNWARWYNATRSRVILLRPDNKGTTRASFNFLAPHRAYEDLASATQKEVLKKKLADAGWEAARLAEELDRSEDVYFDAVSQVKAPRWTKGRFAMVGDAAYCPSPLTGMGTSLAILGAYVLAGELAQTDDYRQAFAAYEKRLRPYVESVQRLPPGVPWIVYPRTRRGVALLNRIIRFFASRTVKSVFKLFQGRGESEEEFVLPEYESYKSQTP